MNLKVKSISGTLESSDIQVIVEPGTNGIEIELESVVFNQYSEDIKSTILSAIEEFGVTSCKIFVNDKGAITPVIKSRVQTAFFRALELKSYDFK